MLLLTMSDEEDAVEVALCSNEAAAEGSEEKGVGGHSAV